LSYAGALHIPNISLILDFSSKKILNGIKFLEKSVLFLFLDTTEELFFPQAALHFIKQKTFYQ